MKQNTEVSEQKTSDDIHVTEWLPKKEVMCCEDKIGRFALKSAQRSLETSPQFSINRQQWFSIKLHLLVIGQRIELNNFEGKALEKLEIAER